MMRCSGVALALAGHGHRHFDFNRSRQISKWSNFEMEQQLVIGTKIVETSPTRQECHVSWQQASRRQFARYWQRGET
jgi:hypothetical protein